MCANVNSSELVCVHASTRVLCMFTYKQVFVKWK